MRTASVLTLGVVVSGDVDPLMRESPPPAFAGVAGLLDGLVVVAIAKCMALCGLRPDGGRGYVKYALPPDGRPPLQENWRPGPFTGGVNETVRLDSGVPADRRRRVR